MTARLGTKLIVHMVAIQSNLQVPGLLDLGDLQVRLPPLVRQACWPSVSLPMLARLYACFNNVCNVPRVTRDEYAMADDERRRERDWAAKDHIRQRRRAGCDRRAPPLRTSISGSAPPCCCAPIMRSRQSANAHSVYDLVCITW